TARLRAGAPRRVPTEGLPYPAAQSRPLESNTACALGIASSSEQDALTCRPRGHAVRAERRVNRSNEALVRASPCGRGAGATKGLRLPASGAARKNRCKSDVQRAGATRDWCPIGQQTWPCA